MAGRGSHETIQRRVVACTEHFIPAKQAVSKLGRQGRLQIRHLCVEDALRIGQSVRQACGASRPSLGEESLWGFLHPRGSWTPRMRFVGPNILAGIDVGKRELVVSVSGGGMAVHIAYPTRVRGVCAGQRQPGVTGGGGSEAAVGAAASGRNAIRWRRGLRERTRSPVSGMWPSWTRLCRRFCGVTRG